MTICDPTETPSGESVKTVTVVAEAAPPGAQWGAAKGAVRGPAMMSVTVTMFGMSGARPTAPFQVNPAAYGPGKPVHGALPAVAPSVVAGSPRVSGAALTALYGVLKTLGNWVDGLPAATSAKPESGQKENMNVCVPSA